MLGEIPAQRRNPEDPQKMGIPKNPAAESVGAEATGELHPDRTEALIGVESSLGAAALKTTAVKDTPDAPPNNRDTNPVESSTEAGETEAARERWKLVERAQQRDNKASTELYQIYHGLVFDFIKRRVRSTHQAEDLTSDVFERALRKIDTVSWRGKDYAAWLLTVASNLVADYFKSASTRLVIPTDAVTDTNRRPDHAESPENDPERSAIQSATTEVLRVILEQAMEALTDEQRTCIRLRFSEELKVAETARRMGTTEGAVKAMQYRAIQTLRRLIPESDKEQLRSLLRD